MSNRSAIVSVGLLTAALAAAGSTYRVYTTRPDYVLEQGRAALQRGNWKQVERDLEFLETRGHRDHAHLLRAELRLREAHLAPETNMISVPSMLPGQSSFRLALHELAQIKDEGNMALEATVHGAECLVRLGERPFAVEVLNRVVKRNPDHKEAHQWLAAIYIDLSCSNAAIVHLREWARLEPHNGRPYRWIGWFFSKDYTKHKEAIDAYREALQRDLDASVRTEVIKELAQTFVDGPADYQAALDTLMQCPELTDQPEVLTLKAQCLWGLARPTEALQALDSALRANPDLPRALQLRAKMFLADNQTGAAVPLLEKVLKLASDDHFSRQLLMQAYRQLGDDAHVEQQRRLLEETRAYKDRLIQLLDYVAGQPWDARARNEIVDLYLKLHMQAEAQRWRQAASACAAQPSETASEQTFLLPERN